MPPYLVLDRLDKRFGPLPVIQDLSLEVEAGEIFSLLGPSGSGKTTLLRLLAGFEEPDGGRVVVGGREVTRLPPAKRRFGMVFQHYALFPHLTVGENVAFGLEARGVPRRERQARVAEVLKLVDLAGFEERRVGEISGGQQQRVALARALAPEPQILLLDEPLSNLDPSLRERTRRELKATIERVSITTLLVTHEQEEAFALASRVGVLHQGRLQQVGTPVDLYREPANRFVATFIGRSSALSGVLEEVRDGLGWVRLERTGAGDGPEEPVRWQGVPPENLEDWAPGVAVDLLIRPEALTFAPPGTPGALPGRIVERRFAGAATHYLVVVGDGREVEISWPLDALAPGGDEVWIQLRPGGDPPRIFQREVQG